MKPPRLIPGEAPRPETSKAQVLLLATFATKEEELRYFQERLDFHGVTWSVFDISLFTEGTVLSGPGKLEAMDRAVEKAIAGLTRALEEPAHAVVGLGGGTGGEIILRAMRALPITFPKLLVTTLPFDPRVAIADNSIVLVPTLVDMCGLNATLREVLENAAAMTAGLCATRRRAAACVAKPSVAVTGLGATDGAVAPLVARIRAHRHEATVFHANGYGGAAFARFAERGAFHTIIDLTPHELTRIKVNGAHVDMPKRFSAGGDVPRVTLPGALNFVGLGEKRLVPPRYLERPHYEHSGMFTHAQLTHGEMYEVATALAKSLSALSAPQTLIVPMGGFSHHDRPGGAIEDAELRETFLSAVKAKLSPQVTLKVMKEHIFAPAVTDAICAALPQTFAKDPTHV
ncbi:MAG: Tm-1-like ATP-binding domain-containing protein [Pseudomonadota bacterium]